MAVSRARASSISLVSARSASAPPGPDRSRRSFCNCSSMTASRRSTAKRRSGPSGPCDTSGPRGRSRFQMSLRILFMMKHPGTARNFEGALRLLAERGHELQLAIDSDLGEDAERLLLDLRNAHPAVWVELGPRGNRDVWA